MYAQVEKPKGNENGTGAKSVTQKTCIGERGFSFVDNRTIQRLVKTTVKKVKWGQRRVYNNEGKEVGTLPENTKIVISDNTVNKELNASWNLKKNRNVYELLQFEGHLQNVVEDMDKNRLFINSDGINQADNEEADKIMRGGKVGIDKQATEYKQACWNWALTGTKPGEIEVRSTMMFTFVSMQVPERVGGNGSELTEIETLKILNLDGENLRHFNLEKSELQQMVQNLKNIATDNNANESDAIKNATKTLMIKTIKSYGMTPLNEEAAGKWKICMHERIDKIGYEHWWLKDPGGYVVETWPEAKQRVYSAPLNGDETRNEQRHISTAGRGAQKREYQMNVYRIPVENLTQEHYKKMAADGKLL